MKPADNNQGELLPKAVEPAPVFLARLEDRTGEYTAERFAANRPGDYQLVVYLLAKGHGPQFIEDWFRADGKKLSKNTVKGVRRALGETLDLLKERVAAEAFVAADNYRDAAQVLLAEIMADPSRRAEVTLRDVQSLEVMSGIATQNGQLISGQPTARVAVQDLRPPGHDDYNRLIAGLPSAKAIEVSTHLMGETAGEKEGGSAGEQGEIAAAAPLVAVGASGRADSDCESDGNVTETQQKRAND